MGTRGNRTGEVRATSTFDSFQPQTPSQEEGLAKLKRLAQSIVEKAEQIVTDPSPFDRARFIFVWGQPGRGKTHLLEALVNSAARQAPSLLQKKKLYLSRYDFTLEHIGGVSTYENAPIVLIDDMWSNKQNIADLSPYTDLKVFIEFIMDIYERKTLVITSSNFPLKDGILERIAEIDKQGRALSRLKEIMSSSGEIEVQGPDYREMISRSGLSSPFEL